MNSDFTLSHLIHLVFQRKRNTFDKTRNRFLYLNGMISVFRGKNALTTTILPSTNFLFIVVSLPSHCCTWFREPLAKVTTLCKDKFTSLTRAPGWLGKPLAPCWILFTTGVPWGTFVFNGMEGCSLSDSAEAARSLSSCGLSSLEEQHYSLPWFSGCQLWSLQIPGPAWRRSLCFWRYFLFL